MHRSIDTPLSHFAIKLVSSLQPWSRPPAGFKKLNYCGKNLAGPFFDQKHEQLFWRERRSETLNTLKTALVLGALGFLGFAILDFFTIGLTNGQLMGRLLVVIGLSYLFMHLHLYPHPISRFVLAARLAAGMSILNLAGIVLTDNNPLYYTETWSGLLPIYFFIYGQLFMPIAETVLFGWFAMLLLPLSAYLTGADAIMLTPSIMTLTMINLFGFCTRCQLERHSRRAYLARLQVESAAQKKYRFLQQISHNLRQPLQALSCNCSVLEAVCAEQPGFRMQHIVGRMGDTVDELNNAFNHILDIANLEIGHQQPKLTALDINVLLSALEDQYAPQAAKKGLKLHIRLRSQPPYNVYSDACILNQIVGNLIDNAIKYTRSGWIVVSAVKIGGNLLKLRVCDTGMGISSEQFQTIFEEFHRGPQQCRLNDPPIQGLGIGLTYVKKALEYLPEHRLGYASKVNFGSDFYLQLPVAPCPDSPKQTVNIRADVAGCFVIAVDDDPVVLQALARQLCQAGCIVQTAASKAETAELLAENLRPPDLLISDFLLNGQENAHDIIALLAEEYGPIPALILSAHAITAADRNKFPPGTQLLRKPANAAKLTAKMAKAMGKEDEPAISCHQTAC